MTWIQPLELETWLVNVFSGTPEIFLAIALLLIGSVAGFFRMSVLPTVFIMFVFLIMFSSFISSPLLILITLLGGLVIGYVLQKTFTN